MVSQKKSKMKNNPEICDGIQTRPSAYFLLENFPENYTKNNDIARSNDKFELRRTHVWEFCRVTVNI